MSTVVVPGSVGENPTVVTTSDNDDYGRRRNCEASNDTLLHEIIEGQRITGDGTISMTRDVGSVKLTQSEIEGRTRLESTRDVGSVRLQASEVEARGLLEAAKNAAATQILVQRTADAALLDATKNAAAATLAMSTGFAAQAAQLAECCCKAREEARDQTDRVLDRINHIEDARRATELVDCKMELNFARYNNHGHRGHGPLPPPPIVG